VAGEMLEYVVQPNLVDTPLRVRQGEQICVTVRNGPELNRVHADWKVDIDVPIEVTLTTAEM